MFRAHSLVPNVAGIKSICSDDAHVLFLEFDDTVISHVWEACRIIQERWQLGTIYIFESSKNNYHAMCLDKLTFGTCMDIQKSTGTMQKYMLFSVVRGYWVLRVTQKGDKPKPRLVSVMEGRSEKTKSWVHWKFLNLEYGIRKVSGLEKTGSELPIDRYTTEIRR
mgnify:CR=1 FL=1